MTHLIGVRVTPANPRLAWIDWLKVIVVLGVFAYHAAQPFVLTSWIVVDQEKSIVLSALAGLGYLFGMPLMFLLAGAASWVALQHTPTSAFIAKRLRLAVPLIGGILVLSPLQAWIGAVTRGAAPSLPEFALRFWRDVDLVPSPLWLGTYGYHLWFIGFLLIYSVASAPLLVRLGPRNGLRRTPTATFLLAPIGALLVSQLPLRVAFPAYRDWADFALWFVYFLLGAAMVAWRPLFVAMTERGFAMLLPAIGLAVAMVPIFLGGAGFDLEAAPRYDATSIGYLALRAAVGWCWVVVAVAIGARWLDRRPVEARAASGFVLPFYVLHHPAVVVVAAVAVTWPVGLWLKFIAIVGISLAVSLAASLAVARTPVLRPLLGMGHPQPMPPLTARVT
jgi:hypothetical protein